MHDLIITHEFGAYRIGQRITDPDLIAELSDGPNASKTVKVAADTRLEEPPSEDDPQELAPSAGGVLSKVASAVGFGKTVD